MTNGSTMLFQRSMRARTLPTLSILTSRSRLRHLNAKKRNSKRKDSMMRATRRSTARTKKCVPQQSRSRDAKTRLKHLRRTRRVSRVVLVFPESCKTARCRKCRSGCVLQVSIRVTLRCAPSCWRRPKALSVNARIEKPAWMSRKSLMIMPMTLMSRCRWTRTCLARNPVPSHRALPEG